MNVPKNNIIYHCDNLYVDWVIISIRSVLANNKNIKFHIIADINYSNVKKFFQLQNCLHYLYEHHMRCLDTQLYRWTKRWLETAPLK